MDELTLMIHSVLAGSGRRIFEDGASTRLTLRDLKQTSKGNVLATYSPREA